MRQQVLALLTILAGCPRDNGPTCDEVTRNVTGLARMEDRDTQDHPSTFGRPPPQAQYLPLYAEFPKTVQARCRDGKLSREARECFTAARSGLDLDRCAHDHGL